MGRDERSNDRNVRNLGNAQRILATDPTITEKPEEIQATAEASSGEFPTVVHVGHTEDGQGIVLVFEGPFAVHQELLSWKLAARVKDLLTDKLREAKVKQSGIILPG